MLRWVFHFSARTDKSVDTLLNTWYSRLW